jgi:hypothetical protein
MAMLLACGIAHADDLRDELSRSLAHPAPGKGLERAPLRAPSWCAHASFERDEGWPATIQNELRDYRGGHYSQYRLIEAARALCNAPGDPLAARVATEIEQYWINDSGLSEADAIESISARVDVAELDAGQHKLCDALAGDEPDDARQKLQHAYQFLFGCNSTAMWMGQAPDMAELGALLDRGPVEADPIARTAWLLYREYKLLEEGEKPERALLGYVIDQQDLHAVTAADALRALDRPPFAGSAFARILIKESVARERMLAARIDDAVAALTRDPAWKELLVTAPQRGAAAWLAAAAAGKAVLARSDAAAAATPRHHGRHAHAPAPDCAPLRADFLALAKKLKHDNLATFRAQLDDQPLAGLLLHRIVGCELAAGDQAGGQALDRLAGEVRLMPGPRMAALFAAADALADLGDRIRVEPSQLPWFDDEPREGRTDLIENVGTHGVIASLAKTAKGLHVTFVKKRVQEMSQKCAETNKIDRIEQGGKVVYRTVCHDTGLVWVDEGPLPVDVSTAHIAALRVGRFVRIDDSMYNDTVPITVFSDTVGKHLVAVCGFVLE